MSNSNTSGEKKSYSDKEVIKIASNLSRKLGPEFIRYRTGFGGMSLAYIEGWAVIQLANQIFGFNGWSSEIRDIKVDYEDLVDNKFYVGISCTTRVTLRDGSFHEDVGFGSCDNSKMKSIAFEKAKKEAATDSLKRTLRQFGNALGNCFYDKEYLIEIKGVKKEDRSMLNSKALLRKRGINDFYNDNIGNASNSFEVDSMEFSSLN